MIYYIHTRIHYKVFQTYNYWNRARARLTFLPRLSATSGYLQRNHERVRPGYAHSFVQVMQNEIALFQEQLAHARGQGGLPFDTSELVKLKVSVLSQHRLEAWTCFLGRYCWTTATWQDAFDQYSHCLPGGHFLFLVFVAGWSADLQ